MTTKLRLYNGACRILGETKLASLTEERPLRYLLDDIYQDQAIRTCLEAGQWNFATRSIEAAYDPDVAPDFGYSRAFSKGTDWVLTTSVCEDEWYRVPLLNYEDENNNIYCELETLYLKYISDDAQYGGDLSIWPESFNKFVQHYLANSAANTHVKDRKRRLEIKEDYVRAKRYALNKDAANQPTQFPAEGSFVRARRGRSSRRDRGNRGQLIG